MSNLSQDTSADSQTFLKLMANAGFKEVLAELGRPVTEKTKTTTTVAAQQGYQMPVDFNWIKSFKVTIGTIHYTPDEEESQEQWNYLTSQPRSGDIPEAFFVRPRFGVGGTEVQIYPTPSTSGNTITVVYEATDKDLSVAKYTTGTVALTNGSATVTGSGTTFTRAMVGRYFQVTDADGDGLWYKVSGYTSATVITLENFYQGTTDSSNTYQIAEAFGLPEDLHMLPIYFSLWHYSLFKKDADNVAQYGGMYKVGLLEAKRRHGTKSRSNIIKGNRRLSNRSGSYPGHFPVSIV
jgi:hypothetical protein